MQWRSKGDGTISISVSLIWEFLAKWNMCIYTSSLLVWRFEKLVYFIGIFRSWRMLIEKKNYQTTY